MKLNKIKLLLPPLFFLAFVVSCSDDDDGVTIQDPVMEEEMEEEEEEEQEEEATTIVDLAVATDDLSILVQALTEAELVETLQGDGPFTVFAPTNAAFEAFLADNNFASLDDIPDDVLEQVLLNHVVSGDLMSGDLSTTYVSSLSTAGVGEKKYKLVCRYSGWCKNQRLYCATADVEASNGVVHIVDQVIGLPNVVDHALYNASFSELVGALTMDDNTTFTDLLSDGEQMFTVFAPVNDAFAAFENPNGFELDNILSYHVIAGASLAAADLSNMYASTAATNADGDNLSIYVNVDDGGVKLNGGSSVVVSDVVTTNGIIHAVDTVIDLPTVVTFAVADSENFSSLVGALTADDQPDFVSVLSSTTDNTPFTVFAPINSAFEALAEVPSGETLTAVLNHHVIAEANVRAEDLTDGLVSPATLEGDSVTFTEADGSFTITDGAGNMGVGIVKADVQAMNGVIHAVDMVLIPDTEN